MLTLEWLPNVSHSFEFQDQHQGVYGTERIFGDIEIVQFISCLVKVVKINYGNSSKFLSPFPESSGLIIRTFARQLTN